MPNECDICRGSGRIRLPRYARLPLKFDPVTAADTMTVTVAEFPCPQCKADSVPFERLDAVRVFVGAYSEIKEVAFEDRVKESLAHDLAFELLKRGYIKFERGKEDIYQMTVPWKATVNVVAPQLVATMEQRVAQRQYDVAAEVIAETPHPLIVRPPIVDFLLEAFKKIKDKNHV